MTLLLLYAFVSIFFSFLCSILEAVLLSVTPTFVNVKMKEGKMLNKYLDPCQRAKKAIEHQGDRDTNCKMCTRNCQP